MLIIYFGTHLLCEVISASLMFMACDKFVLYDECLGYLEHWVATGLFQ